MARDLTARQAAARLERWRAAGFDPAIVSGLLTSLDQDKHESVGRDPHRSGALARSIRVVNASVHQRGVVGYPAQPKTRAHVIGAQGSGWVARWQSRRGRAGTQASGKQAVAFVVRGRLIIRRSVRHPGSRFRALGYIAE